MKNFSTDISFDRINQLISGNLTSQTVSAGLPYFNPHGFSSPRAYLGKTSRSIEEFKAWSQNLGHENGLITFTSYGIVSPQRQGEIIRDLAKPLEDKDAEIVQELRKMLNKAGMNV